MNISTNALYQSDCLALLERIEAEQVTLAYIDAPSYPPIQLPSRLPNNEDLEEGLKRVEVEYQEGLNEHLTFLSKVFQQIQRILSPTGNVFIQSEHHLTGYIRQILDQTFRMRNFCGEIIWPNSQGQSRQANLNIGHDTIFHYSKTSSFVHNRQFRSLSKEELSTFSNHTDKRGMYSLTDITSPIATTSLQFEWDGILPPVGRSWRYTKEQLEELYKEERIIYRSKDGLPLLKIYADDYPKTEAGSVWEDIPPVIVHSNENLNFQNQKPLILLERIILMGSNAGDLVIDPFFGSGTTLVAAQKNGRKWLGCDLSAEAYSLSVKRLEETFSLHHVSDFYDGDQQFLEKKFPVIYNLYNLEIGRMSHIRHSTKLKFTLNESVSEDETRNCEYKEIRGSNPIDAIKNTVDEYAVAFLNSEGGSIYWGIRNDRVVIGVDLNYEQRDKLRRLVMEQLVKIQPAIAPTLYRIFIHPIQENDSLVLNRYVVEVTIPKISSKFLYFTGGNESYIKTDAGKKKLTVSEIHEEIIRRNFSDEKQIH